MKRVNIKKLQDIAVKSRLIRYGKDGNMLYPRYSNYNMTLIINGKIKGPEYDTNRYLHLLHRTGWKVIPASYALTSNIFLEGFRR